MHVVKKKKHDSHFDKIGNKVCWIIEEFVHNSTYVEGKFCKIKSIHEFKLHKYEITLCALVNNKPCYI